jgi:hypothetical protein
MRARRGGLTLISSSTSAFGRTRWRIFAIRSAWARSSSGSPNQATSRRRRACAKSSSRNGFFYLKALLGRLPQIGFAQHRWFVEIDQAHVRFTAKDHMILLSRNYFITRGDLRRKLTEEESGVGLFWSGSFSCE